MHSGALAALLAALLIPSALIPSAESSRTPNAVTEEDFLAALDEGRPVFAPVFLGLDEDVRLARAKVTRLSTYENPEVEVVREDPTGDARQLDFTVAWQLPDPTRRLSIAAAEREVGAARAVGVVERLAVRLDLRGAFAEWAVAVARAECSRAFLVRLAGLAERERRRAERGEASGLEARRLELAVAGARGRLALAEATALRARSQALSWRPDLPPGAVPVLPELPAAFAGAEDEHPRLTALAAELEAARLVRQAAHRTVRWPKLLAGWQRQEAGTETIDGVILGFSWPLPVADRRQAERLRSQARAAAAEARLELSRRRVEAERDGTSAAYERLAAATAEARNAIADNEKLVEAAVAAFRYGEASLTDLLETLRSAVDSELAALELHAAALAAHRDLEAAAGQVLNPIRTKP